MSQSKKRILSWLLTLAFLLTMMPAVALPAFADEVDESGVVTDDIILTGGEDGEDNTDEVYCECTDYCGGTNEDCPVCAEGDRSLCFWYACICDEACDEEHPNEACDVCTDNGYINCVAGIVAPDFVPLADAVLNSHVNLSGTIGTSSGHYNNAGTYTATFNINDVLLHGGWFWDVDTDTLTLNGLAMTANAPYEFSPTSFVGVGFYLDMDPGQTATVYLHENSSSTIAVNTTNFNTYGIYCDANLVIEGSGSLRVSTTAINRQDITSTVVNYGIYSGGTLEIRGGYIEAVSGGMDGSVGATNGNSYTLNRYSAGVSAANGFVMYGGAVLEATSGAHTGNATATHILDSSDYVTPGTYDRLLSMTNISAGILVHNGNFDVSGGTILATAGIVTGNASATNQTWTSGDTWYINNTATTNNYSSGILVTTGTTRITGGAAVTANSGGNSSTPAVIGNETGSGTSTSNKTASGIYSAGAFEKSGSGDVVTNAYDITSTGTSTAASAGIYTGGTFLNNSSDTGDLRAEGVFRGIHSASQFTMSGGTLYAEATTRVCSH